MSADHDERMRRWRLVLGEAAGIKMPLDGGDTRIDAALGALYDSNESSGCHAARQREAGFGASAPRVARWLGDIRTFFRQPDEQATAARRHRLGPDDPRQPAELPAAA